MQGFRLFRRVTASTLSRSLRLCLPYSEAAGSPTLHAGITCECVSRLRKGLDAVVANEVNGFNAMRAY